MGHGVRTLRYLYLPIQCIYLYNYARHCSIILAYIIGAFGTLPYPPSGWLQYCILIRITIVTYL